MTLLLKNILFFEYWTVLWIVLGKDNKIVQEEII